MNEQDTNTPEPIEQPAESPQEASPPAPNDSIVDALTAHFNDQLADLQAQIETLRNQVSERDKTIQVLTGDRPGSHKIQTDFDAMLSKLGMKRRS